MQKLISLFLAACLVLTVSSLPVFAAADHSTSDAVGEAADAAGQVFVQGAREIVKPFIVVGKTVIHGVAFVILKCDQVIVYAAEETIYGLKYVAEGARFIIIKTAQGIRYIAVEAVKAAEIILDAALQVTILVIDGVEYCLLKLEDGFVFVAKKAIEAGKVAIRGVKYVVKKTAEGVVWVTEKTWNAIKAGASWTRDHMILVKVRSRLAASLVAGSVSPDTMAYFQDMSVNNSASEGLRRVSAAALAACKAFVATYRP